MFWIMDHHNDIMMTLPPSTVPWKLDQAKQLKPVQPRLIAVDEADTPWPAESREASLHMVIT